VSPPGSGARLHALLRVGLALAIPSLVFAAVSSAHWSAAPGEVFTGVWRSDLLHYLAYAREAGEAGGLVYGHAFSDSFDSARVFSNLEILLLGWTWRITGIPVPWLWQLARPVAGWLMLWGLWGLVAQLFPRSRYGEPERSFAYALLALGGGALWLLALGGGTAGLLDRFRVLAIGTAAGTGWAPSVFANALYPSEAFYHALAFATLVALLRDRPALVLLGLVLLFWSHPFTGAELVAIVGAFSGVEWLLAGRDRRRLAFALAVAAVAAPFLLYYLVWLPQRSDEARFLLDAWTGPAARYLLHPGDAPAMWGIFLLGPMLQLLPGTRSLRPGQRRSERLVLVWLGVVLLLVTQDRWLPAGVRPVQPLHFTHGYLFVPLAVLTLQALLRRTAGWGAARRRLAATALLLMAALDSVLLVAAVATSPDRVVLSRDLARAIGFLAEQRPPSLVLPLTAQRDAWAYLLAVSPHRLYLDHPLVTPGYTRKRERVQALVAARRPAERAAALRLRWIVLESDELYRRFAAEISAGRARVALEAGHLRVLEISAAPG
jgi:hypothetical protein